MLKDVPGIAKDFVFVSVATGRDAEEVPLSELA